VLYLYKIYFFYQMQYRIIQKENDFLIQEQVDFLYFFKRWVVLLNKDTNSPLLFKSKRHAQSWINFSKNPRVKR
jgi:hypothetical protein